MSISTTLVDACVQFAAEVSPEAVARVVALLEAEGMTRAGAGLSGDAGQRYSELKNACSACADVPSPAAVACLLSGASRALAVERKKQQVELVWSGPTSVSSTLRSSGPALLELIRGANESVYLVTFAAYRVPEIAVAVTEAVKRGTRVVFILESDSASGGKVTFDPLPHLRGDARLPIEVYEWPAAMRKRDSRGRHGSLHAKFAVADRRRLLISSANLTEDAFDLNIELGILVTGGTAPVEAASHVDDLIRRGVLCRQRSAG
jgi:cardiolipin synthase A/B